MRTLYISFLAAFRNIMYNDRAPAKNISKRLGRKRPPTHPEKLSLFVKEASLEPFFVLRS